MRLCHSRMSFIRAYPREAQEMLFDAHDKAFAFYRGACERGIYDNMKTAVDAIFVGKERLFNRRFLQMMSHYLVEPTPCTPAAGEKGQIENQVGIVRQRFFSPRLKFKCRSAPNPDPPKARAGAKPSGATLRCAPSVLAQRLHNLEGGHLFDADPGQQFKAV